MSRSSSYYAVHAVFIDLGSPKSISDAKVLANDHQHFSERVTSHSTIHNFAMTDTTEPHEANPTMSEPEKAPISGDSTVSTEDIKSTPADPKAALAARMARFKTLQAQKVSGRKATEKEVRDAEDRTARLTQISKLQDAHDKASYKLLKSEDPDFERKRNWDYTVEESESWDKRMAKKARSRDNVAFADYTKEANKVYKRQIKQMDKVDLESYASQKAEKLQRQVHSGLLKLVESPDGDLYTVNPLNNQINTPAEESYSHDHKPSKEAIDKLVADLDKGEKARLKARAARGIRDEQDGGDVTYINQKNKQFNDKLTRFYNKYTTEIRESFERGTAI
jgi:pre-mRNA-splicing factor SYF2